jgi:hypothetical protein
MSQVNIAKRYNNTMETKMGGNVEAVIAILVTFFL